MYDINRYCTYTNHEYKVISVLGSDLLLVALKQDIEGGKFPLQTVIIPDEEVIGKQKLSGENK